MPQTKDGCAERILSRRLNPCERVPLFLVEVAREAARIDASCPRPLARDGWIYAIRQHTGSSLIKIGKAADPLRRLAEIQAMNASELQLVGLAHGASLEGDLHFHLSKFRAHGEWFDVRSNPIPATERGCFGCSWQVVR